MNKKLNIIFISFFAVFWMGFAVFNILTPFKEYSENENKMFSHFPSFSVEKVLSGDFMSKIDNYVNEQFAFRDDFIAVKSSVEYFSGKRENNGIFICDDALMQKFDAFDEEKTKINVDAINGFTSQYEIPVYVMIVPSACEVQKDKLHFGATVQDQSKLISDIYSSVKGAECIDVLSSLTEHKDEYIFYRTDHHWTTYGSYIAYKDFCKVKKFEKTAECDLITVSDAFNGTSYSKSGVRFITPDVIERYVKGEEVNVDIYSTKQPESKTSLYFEEYLSVKDKYSYFLGENKPIITLKGNDGNGKKLLIFKDSYAHCMAPFLLENYDEIMLVDCRYLKYPVNDVTNIEDFDDVLFLYGVESFATTNELYILPYLTENNRNGE